MKKKKMNSKNVESVLQSVPATLQLHLDENQNVLKWVMTNSISEISFETLDLCWEIFAEDLRILRIVYRISTIS